MPEVIVTNRSGEETRIDAHFGVSLMQAICEAGFDEVLALCGGVCSCATCHVYVSGGPVEVLEPMGEDEDLLLDGSDNRQESSRLSCQILVTDAIDGLRVTIAPED